MALNKAGLRTQLIDILNNPQTTSNVVAVATALADAIDTYIKTGNATGTDSRGDIHNLRIE